eukprot:GHVQ01018679.1.p1 GENE.GHVQ01018679.1~~GHVQ01018679.1.p1  ORF type:complete len:343 (-),score=24.07 GHVQ01018679.1:1492-2520(-)
MARNIISLVLANKLKSPSKEALPYVEKLTGRGVSVLLGNTIDDFKHYGDAMLNKAELLIVIPPGDVRLLPELWALAPNINWVHSWYVGVENLQPFMQSHLLGSPVLLTNARSSFSSSLAEWVLAVALHFEKQVPRIMHNSIERIWDKFVMGELRGKTMGFIGYGDIAQTVARIAKNAFGMKCIALRRDKTKRDGIDLLDNVFYQDDEPLEVYRKSDFVVCTLPGTPATLNSVGAPHFEAMNNHGIFISIGRGTVVDEKSLSEAIQQKQIGGAALDVFHQEPLDPSSELWNHPNVLITAHNADWVASYGDKALHTLERNLQIYLEGERRQSMMYSPVDKMHGY